MPPPQRDVTWRDVELTATRCALSPAARARFRRHRQRLRRRLRGRRVAQRTVSTSGQVNAGGDLRVFGARERADPRAHRRPAGRPPATGGNRRRRGRDERVWGRSPSRRRRRWATPLIDPRAGLPMMSTRTVSVIAPTCMLADALTKVVALRGRAASRVLRDYGASATVLSPAAGRWRCMLLPAAARAAALGQTAMSSRPRTRLPPARRTRTARPLRATRALCDDCRDGVERRLVAVDTLRQWAARVAQ